MDDDDLKNRFTYHPPKNLQPERYELIRKSGLRFAQLIAQSTPASREQSLAVTHIEDAVMWTNAAIARHE